MVLIFFGTRVLLPTRVWFFLSSLIFFCCVCSLPPSLVFYEYWYSVTFPRASRGLWSVRHVRPSHRRLRPSHHTHTPAHTRGRSHLVLRYARTTGERGGGRGEYKEERGRRLKENHKKRKEGKQKQKKKSKEKKKTFGNINGASAGYHRSGGWGDGVDQGKDRCARGETRREASPTASTPQHSIIHHVVSPRLSSSSS